MATFQDLLTHAEEMLKSEPNRADYWAGYVRGLHRGYFGHDADLEEEPEWLFEESDAYSLGHSDGYHAGQMAESGGG